jgi:hypothetical protein
VPCEKRRRHATCDARRVFARDFLNVSGAVKLHPVKVRARKNCNRCTQGRNATKSPAKPGYVSFDQLA